MCVGGGVVKVSSIGIGRKGVRFKRAFIMLRYAKKKMSHSTILFAWRLRECVFRHFGSVEFHHGVEKANFETSEFSFRQIKGPMTSHSFYG